MCSPVWPEVKTVDALTLSSAGDALAQLFLQDEGSGKLDVKRLKKRRNLFFVCNV